jgi:two-component system CheB/CheR fusion protein
MKKSSLETQSKEKSFPIVAIGASAGGLEAVSALLKKLPPGTGMAYIYVQHLSPDHKSLLTSILSKITKMKVQEIEDMEHILPNNLYIIPPNKGIEVIDGHIKLLPHSVGSLAISIDVLFSSLAQTHKENVIGIILSGYASDGMIGLKAIKEAGGITFAQDDSAQASSMPRSAIASGVVDFILSPEEIAAKLVTYSKNNFRRSKISSKKKVIELENINYDLNTIFELLLKATGVDFSHYKVATIKRRLNHKILESGLKSIKEYVKLIIKDKKELENLYKDLLINVTDFFRDKEVFGSLKKSVLPKLIKNKTSDDTLRIWVAACSTGQEAYSIAMMIIDLQKNKSRKIPVKIFATDLDEDAITKARIGEYSIADLEAIPKTYLNRFFDKSGDKYRVSKELREMCVFAPHNILRDPPFSRMDFISCRNLLIYFDLAAQKKVLATLHFALVDGGYLMLGKAETLGTASANFTTVNNKLKFYSRKMSNASRKIIELTPRFPLTNLNTKKTSSPSKIPSVNPSGIDNAIDSLLLSNYMPACVVINKDMEILQFRGQISSFLTHPSGKANLNILKMTRPEFAFELRNAIKSSLKTKQPVLKSGIEIQIDSNMRLASIHVSPLKIEWDEPLLLVVFTLKELIEKEIGNEKSGKNSSTLKDKKIKELIEELSSLRSEINTIIESQETIYEELQTANEEIVSSNEEYQTLNEELETSKEEIEATNEELISTNQELQIRNDVITELHEYSEAIIATIHEPMLVLSGDFFIKSANKSFYETFKVTKEETEGKYFFKLGSKQWNILKLHNALNDVISKNTSFENFEVISTFPEIGERIMLLNAHPIIQKSKSEKLILLAIEDITSRTRYYLKEKYALSLIEASRDPLIAINPEGKITDINIATVNITGLSRKALIGSHFFDYFTESDKAIEVIKEVFTKGSVVNFPLTLKDKEGKITDVLFNGSVYKDAAGNTHGIVLVARDITDQKRIATELSEAIIYAELATQIAEEAKLKSESARLFAEDALKSKQQFLSNMSHEIRTPMNAIIGFTKVVLKTELTAKQKEYLTAIKMSGDTLIVLINDILDLAKVDSGKMTFEKIPFNLDVSIDSMIKLFDTKIQEKNLQLINEYDLKIPEVLIGDPVRLNQIILNLVGNAIKFTSDGKITLRVYLLKEDKENATIQFDITDTGIGISENQLESIFENFQQASTGTSRLYGGTGLGLAIVKQLVESQGGTVKVKSKIGEGSTFSFILSFQKTSEKPVSKTETLYLDKEIKGLKVLVVEDIALNQLLMKTLLDDFGFEWDMAANGKIAIEKLKTGDYDIILMDLQMPEMNGFEATEYVRTTLKSNIPIIALTADVTTVDLDKCKAVGMNDYIAKPIDEKLLYSKIIGLIKVPRAI